MATPVNSDFKGIVRALSSARVRFLVVGGFAVIEHTEPRYTKDLDLWVQPTPANAHRVFRALRQFGAPLKGVEEKDFTAWERRKTVRWGSVRVPILSAADLIANKKRVGRPQDLADVERLQARKRQARSGRR